MTTVITEHRAEAPEHAVELTIGGMTCASCAVRVEKRLNQLDGVAATVNFATQTARVAFPASVTTGDLISAVRQAGYTAKGVRGEDPPGRGVTGGSPPGGEGETESLRRRLLVSLALAAPVVILAMVPAL